MRFALYSHKKNAEDSRYNKATNSFKSNIGINL